MTRAVVGPYMNNDAVPRASERVQNEWRSRVIAEYHSAAITAQLLHWCIQCGVSAELLDKCQQIIKEELEHAEKSREIYLLSGGKQDQIVIDYTKLSYSFASELPNPFRALAMSAQIFCCGETTAVPLFRALADFAVVPQAKSLLEQILIDEAGHQFFGWALLDELLLLLGADAKAWLRNHIQQFTSSTIHAYSSTDQFCSSEDRAWGLMSGAEYQSIVIECVQSTIIPRFRSRGLVGP